MKRVLGVVARSKSSQRVNVVLIPDVSISVKLLTGYQIYHPRPFNHESCRLLD